MRTSHPSPATGPGLGGTAFRLTGAALGLTRAALGLGLCLAGSVQAEPPAHSTWKLTFSDEFEGTTLDASKWSNGYALGATGPGSWPDPANVRISDGSLKLFGEKKAGQGKTYAGAAITNRGKFKQMYGYMEARIKMPKGKGFSAKMTGTKADGGYPPWLDIIETRGEEPDHPYWYIHAGGKEAGAGWNGTNLVSEYHTLGTEWNADELIFYVDGVVKARDKTLASLCRMEMCWALELMVGGDSWIGIPDGTTPWPGVYEIDYARIYARLGPAPVRLSAAPVRAQGATSAALPGFLADGRWWSGRPAAPASRVLCAGSGCAVPAASSHP
ncbi:MAG: glycoside hydrolase family 16 [Fibrobacteres bacterium]|nr:glycoside hydrolase family 16 [Fibrobacterota bacterium]